MTKFISTTSKLKRQINANDKSAIMTISAAVVLLGAFFVINAGGLTAFADVDPEELNLTTGNDGPIHPGEFIVEKNVTLTQSIIGFVNVTFAVYNEGTTDPCVDAQVPPVTVLNLTTTNETTFIPSPQDGFLLYDETFVGMPGVYHCNVVFVAANVTTSSNTELIGNQTIWIDAIGSHGYWKNHPDASDVHTPIILGNQTLNGDGTSNSTNSFNVTDSSVVTAVMNEHKGKFDLDKLAAQLLAAKLNQWALMGSGASACIDQTIIDADNLLRDRGYFGIGEGGKLMKSDKFPALSLHSDLDDFNNVGCP